MTANIEQIIQILSPIINEEGYELLDVWVVSESGQRVLRVYIDKDSGPINLEDCEKVSHAIEDVLEVEDVVSGQFNLEVSSPGIDRPLRTKNHFVQAIEQTVFVQTKEKIDGRKRYKGILKDVSSSNDTTNLKIYIDNKDFVVPLSLVERAHIIGKL